MAVKSFAMRRILYETRTWPMTVQGLGVRGRIVTGICTVLLLIARLSAQEYIRDSRPELFSYDELVKLGSPQELSPELAAKLHALTTTPFINNEAFYRGARPNPLEVEGLGPALRVAFWNIERGLELDDIT